MSLEDIVYHTSKDSIGYLSDDMLRGNETPQHAIKKREKGMELVHEGYKVAFEKKYNDYVIDIIAINGKETLLVEVGKTTKDKMETLREDSSVKVINVPYVRDGKAVSGVVDTSNTSSSGSMRPEIPEWLIQKMNEEPKDVNLNRVYQIGGYQTEGEFIRAAVREKIKELNEKHDI